MTDRGHSTYDTQRRAATQNRLAIIEAARELFALNPLVPLNDVAKKAGVGAGTLYRHFPARNDLVLAVYQRDIDRLGDTVQEVLDRNTSARAAFIEWFALLAEGIRVKHGLGDALHGAEAQGVVAHAWGPASAAVARLLQACVEEGTVAPGHDPADVILLMSFLWRLSPTPEGEAQAHRLVATLFSGLESAPPAAT